MALWWSGAKAPAEIADYDVDWTLRLNGDTITASSWAFTTTDGVLGTTGNSFLPSRTKIWLTGGTVGFVYMLTNTVVTLNGDTLIEDIQLLVKVR